MLFLLPGIQRSILLNILSYEHIIVGARMSSPLPETFGGILADEMGLGKTLTILSAIVGSLEWAHNSTNLQVHESSPLTSSCKRPIKGTLIVVPSVRK